MTDVLSQRTTSNSLSSLVDLDKHTGIEFGSWDMKNHLLHFKLHGTSDLGDQVLDTTLTYQLLENKIVAP